MCDRVRMHECIGPLPTHARLANAGAKFAYLLREANNPHLVLAILEHTQALLLVEKIVHLK